ncbi:uncharacterized protein [Phyllobates terribilis]|uniref:uncharacterized protein n=1 Tax=Phyllobates terribilis TaxID=111132 RepID=UPI003CCB0D86
MGILQESELSENTISKLEEKPRKTSTESSQSPKAAQPSCLRGAFVRIFLKKTEPNNKINRTEEDPSSSQNTEDQEEVKGKKRKVTGGIFRLPCLRAAEKTGNKDIQDRTEEQSNDGVQEEELKPYSKASFLRKIRCYRLMREKDSTEKEKVIEMTQRKHDKENVDVKQCKEKVLEQSEEGLQNIKHVDVVGEKRKDTTEQESQCQAKSLGKADNDVQEQELSQVGEGENSLKKQECFTGKLSGPGKESEKNKGPGQGAGEIDKDIAEQEKSLKNQECCTGKLSGPSEESVTIEEPAQDLGDKSKDLVEQKNNLKKQECCKETLSKQGEDSVKIEEHAGNMDKNLEEHENSLKQQECCIGKLSATEESVKTEEPAQDLGDMSEDLAEQKNNLKKQECCKETLSKLGEESVKIEEPAGSLGGMDEDLAEQKSCVETLKEKGILLEGGLSLQEDKNVAEQENQTEKVEKMLDGDGVQEHEKGALEQKGYGVKVDDLDKALSDIVSQPKEVGKQEKGEEVVMKIDLPKEDSHSVMITGTEELACTKANTFASQLESHRENIGNPENNMSAQQHEEGDIKDVRNIFSGQDGQIEMKGLEQKDMTEWESQGDRADQRVENENHGDKESHDEVASDQGNKLVDQKSQVERALKDTPTETLEDFEDNTAKVSGVSLDVQDEQHYTSNMSNQGPSMLNQESVTSEPCQDSSTKKTLGSEDNKQFLESIGKKTATNIISCASSEEANIKVLGLVKEEVLTPKYAIDHTYQEEHILHTCVNDKDDGMGCESTDLGTLRVEVKDMVEWLVQEASDRLSHYADDSEGTG